jgi:hypothetical protein
MRNKTNDLEIGNDENCENTWDMCGLLGEGV